MGICFYTHHIFLNVLFFLPICDEVREHWVPNPNNDASQKSNEKVLTHFPSPEAMSQMRNAESQLGLSSQSERHTLVSYGQYIFSLFIVNR